MSREPAPLACSLSPDDLKRRSQRWSELASEALLETTSTETGVRFRFRGTKEIGEELRQLVEAESRCCPFLSFEMRAVDREVILDVSSPEEARALIQIGSFPVIT
jgi:hypothetical protein